MFPKKRVRIKIVISVETAFFCFCFVRVVMIVAFIFHVLQIEVVIYSKSAISVLRRVHNRTYMKGWLMLLSRGGFLEEEKTRGTEREIL